MVDDEPFMAHAVATVLELDGFEVTLCQEWTGVAGLVRTENPDLILLDYDMPVVKGDSICEILKRHGAGERMRIVLFSAEPPLELARIAHECGADGFIPKNTPPAELVSAVRRFVGEG